MVSPRLLSAHRLDPNNPNKVISSTYVFNNPKSIQNAQAEDWIIDKIQNPKSNLVIDSSGGQTLRPIINKIIQEYIDEEKKSGNIREILTIGTNTRRPSTEPEKLAILHNVIEKTASHDRYSPPERAQIESAVIKEIEHLIKSKIDISDANSTASNGFGKKVYNIGQNFYTRIKGSVSSCSKHWCGRRGTHNNNNNNNNNKNKQNGGRRTRRAKSRRAKSRRVRRTRRS
jgi:hypothetical protein